MTDWLARASTIGIASRSNVESEAAGRTTGNHGA
jgi:hypothetical protein